MQRWRIGLAMTVALGVLPMVRGADVATPKDGPDFTSAGKLAFPANYREWIFLSSGLGMTYGSPASQAEADPPFDNVFVSRPAYAAFLTSGHWPDGAMFVLEIRSSESHGSISQGGHFQLGTQAVEVHVKDSRRFAGGWAFFGFEGGKTSPAGMIPRSASCYSCHSQHGAVDTTFVQFYPTLLSIAREKGTVDRPGDAPVSAK